MELAALATAAVPGLSPTGVAVTADDARDFSSAVVTDAEGNTWRVRSPQHHEASVRLETELQILRGFSTAIRAELPFRLPSVAGAVRRGEMRTFVYNHLPGVPLTLDTIAAGSSEGLEDGIGRAIAAIHDVDDAVVDNADLPRYTADRFRQRRLNELDQAATTGRIPAVLLRRWETALEDRALWDFSPTVVHGDLHEDNLLMDGGRVVAVTGWTDLHIGDPATDFAWLTAVPQAQVVSGVLEAYTHRRSDDADPHIMRRAALAAEFALAQWLVRGVNAEDPEIISEADSLLTQLAADVDATGGQPIAVTPAQSDASAQLADGPTLSSDDIGPADPGSADLYAESADDFPAHHDPRREWAAADPDDEPAVITDVSVEDPSQDFHPEPLPYEDEAEDRAAQAGQTQEPHAFPRAAAEDAPTDQFAPIPDEIADLPDEDLLAPTADREQEIPAGDPFAEPDDASLPAPFPAPDESGPGTVTLPEDALPEDVQEVPEESTEVAPPAAVPHGASPVSAVPGSGAPSAATPDTAAGSASVDAAAGDPAARDWAEDDSEAPTGTLAPFHDDRTASAGSSDSPVESVETGPLDLALESDAAERSAAKNYFPAGGTETAEETEATEESGTSEKSEAAEERGAVAESAGGSATSSSVYSRHPGLRPPR